jgi:hypothetical protein
MNKKVSHLLLLTVTVLLMISCSPAPFKPYVPPDLKFQETPHYNVQEILDSIPKPDKLERVYVKLLTGNKIEILSNEHKDEATHVLLIPKEYAKIDALLKLSIAYKEIAIEEGVLINTYIDQINALKELLTLERQKVLYYRELWVNSENAYRQEKADHNRDNIINRTGMYIITIGSIIAIALAL